MDQSDQINAIFLRTIGFQRISATPVEIKFAPEGITFIEGKNGSGKSSALDTFAFMVAGKSALSKLPIHEGMEEATGELGLSNGRRIVRHVRRKGDKQYTTALELYGPQGEKFEAREATVREWLGELNISFDPMEFSRMEPKARRILLARLVGIDLDKFDADEKAAEQARLAHYGLYETAKRKHESLPPLPAAKPAGVDVGTLNEQLASAMDAKATADKVEMQAQGQAQNLTRHESELTAANAEVERLKAALADAQGKAGIAAQTLKGTQVYLAECRKEADRLAKLVPDIAAIQAQLATASETNRASIEYEHAVAQRKETEAAWKTESKRRDELTAAVEAVRESRLQSLQLAAFPVEGLGFADDDCTYNAVPFSQASQSEKIRVGLAIAMAQNPKLKMITSYDGSLLDEDSLRIVHEMTQGRGYQFALEVVANVPSGRPHSIYMEEGVAVEAAKG